MTNGFGELERLPGIARTYWILSGAASAAVGGGLLLLFSLPGVLAGHLWPVTIGPGIALLATIIIAVTVGARHRRFAFAVTDEHLYVRDGVFFQREKVIPISRMQHVDVRHGPIERLLGLASLAVFTAGGAGATFRVPALPPERARTLRQAILERRDLP